MHETAFFYLPMKVVSNQSLRVSMGRLESMLSWTFGEERVAAGTPGTL